MADAARIDRTLSEETRLVMRVASLGRAARAKASLKVRQPVQELFVKVPSQMEERALERLAPQVLEELNVKELRIVRDEADFLRFEVKPNLKMLGAKYGRDVQKIAGGAAARGRRTAERDRAGGGGGADGGGGGEDAAAGGADRRGAREGGVRVGGG